LSDLRRLRPVFRHAAAAGGAAAPKPAQLLMVWPESRLASPPEAHVPAGYRLRQYRPEDREAYLRLMARAGFKDWTGAQLDRELNCILPGGFFVIEEAEKGTGTFSRNGPSGCCAEKVPVPFSAVVATAMAAHNPGGNRPFAGALHWVAADPAHAGRGLGRAASAAAVALLVARGYRRIQLLTDDWRLPALKIYLTMGFVPALCAPDMAERWRVVCGKLGHAFAPGEWPGE